MSEKTRCEDCNRTFKDAEGLAMHNQAKHSEKIPKEKKSIPVKKIRNWGILFLILGLIITGIFLVIPNKEVLPPTTMEGHREINPPSHVLKDPMPISMQKHMLEHIDGIEGERGGVIINYNCNDYECEPDLIEKLESFASEFDYVYVAPFNGMKSKIALTKLRRIELLKEYDEAQIKSFIEGR